MNLQTDTFPKSAVLGVSKVQSTRYSLFPIKYPNLFEYYQKQRDAFWVPAEIDLYIDKNEWEDKLTDNDRHFLTFVLAFFSQADGIVLQNLDNNFSIDISIPEVSIFYGIQAGIEAIHWEMYSIIIDTLISDRDERNRANNAIEHFPCIKNKANWISKWMDSKQPFLYRLIAFACTEGIFFSSAFASIYYFKKRGLMPGLSIANKFIARDEGLHRDFACELFKTLKVIFNEDKNMYIRYLKEEGSEEVAEKVFGFGRTSINSKGGSNQSQSIIDIIMEAVEVEEVFVNESLNVELVGINSKKMCQYVRFVADQLLSAIDYPKVYNVDNPFDWMDLIGMTNKQNFFEGRTTEYSKSSNNDIGDISDAFSSLSTF